MNTAFDSLTYYNRLREAGMPESLAQVQADELQKALRSDVSAIRAEMATKSDLAATRVELLACIADVRSELKQDIADLRVELKQDIADVRKEISDVRSELSATRDSIIRWMMGGMVGLAGTIACAMALMTAAR